MSKIAMKIDGSRALVNTKAFNHVYDDLVMLADEAERMAKLCNHMTLRALQLEIKRVSFGYARCYGELNCLILEGKK
jgi:hypothetical protein